jgi:hypothetical protein
MSKVCSTELCIVVLFFLFMIPDTKLSIVLLLCDLWYLILNFLLFCCSVWFMIPDTELSVVPLFCYLWYLSWVSQYTSLRCVCVLCVAEPQTISQWTDHQEGKVLFALCFMETQIMSLEYWHVVLLSFTTDCHKFACCGYYRVCVWGVVVCPCV